MWNKNGGRYEMLFAIYNRSQEQKTQRLFSKSIATRNVRGERTDNTTAEST